VGIRVNEHGGGLADYAKSGRISIIICIVWIIRNPEATKMKSVALVGRALG
jgi:hypothetical protein